MGKREPNKHTAEERAAAQKLVDLWVEALPGALMRLEPTNLDEDAVWAIIGDQAVDTLEDVARAFGVTVGEVEEWERQGAPLGRNVADRTGAPGGRPRPSRPWELSSAKNCKHLRRLRPQAILVNETAIILGGEITATRLAGVAKAFDVSLPTVKAWVAMGMPKPAKRGDPYDLITILDWRVREDKRNAA